MKIKDLHFPSTKTFFTGLNMDMHNLLGHVLPCGGACSLGSVHHTHVSAGSVGFLDQPSMAFVRLQEAVLLESVLEVPVPVRFLFLLLGPPTANIDYHQIGRSISTLMSDKVSASRLCKILPDGTRY